MTSPTISTVAPPEASTGAEPTTGEALAAAPRAPPQAPAAAGLVTACDLTVVIPAKEEEGNIGGVVEGVHRVCRGLGVRYQVLVVDGGSRDRTAEEARRAGAEVVSQKRPGYGAALREAFLRAAGACIVTMDSDLSHPPNLIRTLYRNRHLGDLLIASRYVTGGLANMPWIRRLLSSVLNRLFSRILDLPVADLSSGFRLYRRSMLENLQARNDDFSFLQEVLVQAYCAGYRVAELPFHYFPRVRGVSKARILRFGVSYLKLLYRSFRVRRSVESADYDERAYQSLILPQRWWQRRRYRAITRLLERRGRVLDVGCGSSRIFEALPGGVGLDLNRKKLRYRRTLGNALCCATLFRLPLRSESFDQVICSQVIEHVPRDGRILSELRRVLRPGGTLILGTPDYGRWQWRLTEWLYGKLIPGGYAHEHITHYTRESLIDLLRAEGLEPLEEHYVFQGELIIKARRR